MVRTINYSLAAYWGWTCLKDDPALWSSLGGPADGGVHNFKINKVFDGYNLDTLNYLLFTSGFHMGNIV